MAWVRLSVLAALAAVVLTGCPPPGEHINYEKGQPEQPEGEPALSYKIVVGDVLSVIPLHQGKVSNMHDELVAARDGRVIATWQVRGRGKVR